MSKHTDANGPNEKPKSRRGGKRQNAGGARAGAGRKKGIPNRMTAELRTAALGSGESPLDFLLRKMRSPAPTRYDCEPTTAFAIRYRQWEELCLEAAKAAAPYVHPRLAVVENVGKDGGPMQHKLTVEFVD